MGGKKAGGIFNAELYSIEVIISFHIQCVIVAVCPQTIHIIQTLN